MTVSADERAARRTVVLVVVAIVVGVVAVVIGAVSNLMRNDDEADGGTAATAPPGLEEDPTVSLAIGPRPGTDVAAYIASRSSALANVEGEVSAVISFAEYHTAQSAKDIAVRRGLEPVAYLVALPGGPPALVIKGIDAWVAEQVAAAQEERDSIAELLPTVGDPEFVSFYESEIDRLDRLIAAGGLASVVVYAVAVTGESDTFRELSEDPGVRLIDVAGDVTESTAFRGVRPEETTRTGEPEFRT